MNAAINTSILEHYLEGKLARVFDANAPIERDHVGWKILGRTTKTF